MSLMYEGVVSHLLSRVPALQPEYHRLARQEGEEPSPYLVFGDVLAPYLQRLLTAEASQPLTDLFAVVEEMARSEDPKVRNLVAIEILEPLVSPKAAAPGRRAVSFFGAATTALTGEFDSHMAELPKRRHGFLRSVAIALLVVVAFSLITGARVVYAYRELRCEPEYWPRPLALMGGIYRCEPRPVNPPRPVELPQVAVLQDEVGLYLTRLQVRVFYIDFVAGTYHGVGFGVRLLD